MMVARSNCEHVVASSLWPHCFCLSIQSTTADRVSESRPCMELKGSCRKHTTLLSADRPRKQMMTKTTATATQPQRRPPLPPTIAV
jgi:hypothetical protein